MVVGESWRKDASAAMHFIQQSRDNGGEKRRYQGLKRGCADCKPAMTEAKTIKRAAAVKEGKVVGRRHRDGWKTGYRRG